MANLAINGTAIKGVVLNQNVLFDNTKNWSILNGTTATSPERGMSTFEILYKIDEPQKTIDFYFHVVVSGIESNVVDSNDSSPVLVDLSSIVDNVTSIKGDFITIVGSYAGGDSQSMIIGSESNSKLGFSGAKLILMPHTYGLYEREPITSIPLRGMSFCQLTYSNLI